MKIQNVYAKPQGDVFVAGTPVEMEWSEGLEPLAVRSYEIREIGQGRYLLRVKRRERMIGHSIVRKSGLSVQYFDDGEGNIIGRYGDGTTKIENWLAKGVHTNRGEVVDVGDAFVAVRVAEGKVVLCGKDSLLPAGNDQAETAHVQETRDTLREIQKSIEAGQGKKASEAKSARVQILRLLKGLNFMPQADTTEHNEGETRSFGPNDMRTLMRAQGGELRWMDADEKQKELQRRTGEAQAKTNAKPPTGGTGEAQQKPDAQKPQPKQVKVGDVTVGGAKVIDHADNIVAIKKPDGTTGTMRREDVDKKQSREQDMIAMAREDKVRASKEKHAKDYGAVADEHLQERQAAEDRKFNPDKAAIGETYMREVEAIRQEAKGSPEFQAFAKTVEGWHNSGGLSFERTFKEKIGDDVTRNRTMRKTWNPQEKRAMFELDDRSLRMTLDGKEYEVSGASDDLGKFTLRDEDGTEQEVERHRLDKYRGNIRIDEDGNAYIIKGDKVAGQLKMDAGITQEDLLSPGTIGIVNDEVWKAIPEASGAKFTDLHLGRVQTGIVMFKHGNDAGVIDGSGRTYGANKRVAKRDVPTGALDAETREMQKRVKDMQAKIDAEHRDRLDVNLAKTMIESGQAKPHDGSQPGRKGLEAEKYNDVFDTYFASLGKDASARVAGAYGTDEWGANVKALGELMKVEDVKRAQQIEASNAMSKSGVLFDVPKSRPIEDYMAAADQVLRQKRSEYRAEARATRKQQLRENDLKMTFQSDEDAEIPTSAKAVAKDVQTIRDSKGRQYRVQYAIVPMDSVIQSHDVSGATNPEHPAELQARKREGAVSVRQMAKIAADINDSVVQDNADATNGAPVAYAKGDKVYISQGNGRAAGIKGTEGDQRKKYYGMMVDKARKLGLPTENLNENDMLVRVMTPDHTYQDARKLAAWGQASAALPYTSVESARAYQIAQDRVFDHGVNLEGVGARAIDERNVATFISKNPELYKKIAEDSGYSAEQVEAHPRIQAELINTALLAQLRPKFIDDMAGRDDRTHLAVSAVAPILIDNKKLVDDGKIPKSADLEDFMDKVVMDYSTMDSATKTLMNVKNGQSAFLDATDASHPKALLRQMNQEDMLSAQAGEQNRFRDPMHVIGLMAYSDSMQKRTENESAQAGASRFSLRLRRFHEAIAEAANQPDDMFGSSKLDNEKVIKIAERTLLNNKPWRQGEEQLTPEEAEDAASSNDLSVYKLMKEHAGSRGFKLAGEEAEKSIAAKVIGFLLKGVAFMGGMEHGKGSERVGHKYIRREAQAGGGYKYIYKDAEGKEYSSDEHGGKALPKAHASQKYEAQQHHQTVALERLKAGDTVRYKGDKRQVAETSDNYAVLIGGEGLIFVNKADLETEANKPAPPPTQGELFEYEQKMKPYESKTLDELREKGVKIPPAVVAAAMERPTIQRYKDATGKWEPRRAILHDSFVAEKTAKPPKNVPDGQRECIILAGGGGSGKSTVSKALFGDLFGDPESKNTHVWCDPDQAKAMLPEYNVLCAAGDPIAASLTHEESSHMNKCVRAEAIKNRQNLVIDGTLANQESAVKLMKELQAEGYRIRLVLVDADIDIATGRALERATGTVDGKKKGNGRLPNFGILADANENAPVSFFAVSRMLSKHDEVYAVDNNGKIPQLIYERKGTKARVVHEERFKYFLQKGKAEQYEQEYRGSAEKARKPVAGGVAETPGEDRGGRRQGDAGNEQEGAGEVRRRPQAADPNQVGLFRSLLASYFFKSQGELFAGTPKPTPPKQPTLFSNVKGVDFSRMNGEKPGHKYIRRYRGKSGAWEYVYRDAQGKEFAGDEAGKPLPRHRDWQEGDAVHIGDRDAHIVGFADTMAVVRDTKGETFTVPMKEIEHSTERQARLRGKSTLPSKWQSVVDEHDDDLAQGEQTGKYELGDTKGEVMFKRKLAAEERERRAEEGDPEDGESYADQIKREPESQPELPFGRVAEAKPLYHGTSRTLEGKLQVRKNDKAGVGWNSATLGNAVYLTESEPAAKLFSHVSEQNSYLTNPDPETRTEGANNAGLGNVYKVKLKTGAKVLDASDPLPVDEVKAALKEAGLREDTIGSFNDKELTDFERVMDLLRYAHDVKNGPEYLTKKLGYDALRIKEGSWQNWAYFPEHLGLGPDKFKETPTTVAVYNEDAIEGYEPHKMKKKGAKGAEKSMAAFLFRLFKGAQMALFGDGPQVGDVKMQNGETYKLESRKTWNRPRWIKQETNSNTPEPKKIQEGKRRGKLTIASVPLDHKPKPEVPKSETSHNKETAEKVEKKEPPKDKRAGLPKPPKDEKEYVKSSEYHKKLAADYFDENGNQVHSSRTKKASPTGVKVGDWRIDDKYNGVYGRWIEQVVEFDPSELVPSEDSLERMDDVERYAEWNREGTEPPPINVNQGEDGKFIITDGHRRWLAAKRSGNKVKAWVSWTHPTGKLDYAGKPILTGLTHELANAPEPEEARKQVKAARPTVPENVQKYIEHEIAADFPRNIMHEIETAYLSRDRGEIPANCYRYVSLYRPTFGWLKASDLDAGEVAAREIDGGRKTVFFTTKPISIDKLTRYELTPEGNRTRGRMVLDYMEARGEQAAELVKYDGDSKPRVAVYHKSAKPEHKCVVGYFDERGPFSDDYGNDPEKMIGEALSSGYREWNPGTLDAMAPDFDAELLAAMMRKSMSSWITRRF